MIAIELHGLEVFGYHGVLEDERREGQRFVFDVAIRLREEPRGDDVTATVDYRDVVACVEQVSGRGPFQLLETLAATLADELLARFDPAGVRVRVRKPDVRLGFPVEHSAVVVERP